MYYFEQTDHFKKYLGYAISLHIALLCLSILFSFVFKFKPLKIEIKKDIDTIQTAVRVDVVGLPKHTLKELEKMDLAAAQSEVDKTIKNENNNETSKIEFKKTKKKINMKNLLSRYSQKKVVKKQKKKTKLNVDKLNKIILEGNRISQGSSTTGDNIDQAQEEFVRFVQALPDRVRPYWKLPSYLIDEDLRCRIRIFMGANGALTKLEVYESSGDEEYDQKAITAIKKSSPFPKPPHKILPRVVAGDVILGFPL